MSSDRAQPLAPSVDVQEHKSPVQRPSFPETDDDFYDNEPRETDDDWHDTAPVQAVPPQPVQPQVADQEKPKKPQSDHDQPWYDDVKGTLQWVDLAAAANATTKFIAGHSATEAGGALLSRMLPEIIAGPAVEALGFAASAPVALAAAFVIGGIELYEHRKEIWDMTRHGPLEGQTIQDHPAYKALSGSGGQIFA